MFFKNAMSYRLKKGFVLDLEKIEELLIELKLKEIDATELSTFGWVSPIGNYTSDNLSYTAADRTLFAYAKVEKIIPPGTLKEKLEVKVKTIELETGVTLGNKAKVQLKEDLLIEIAPQAFTKKTIVRGYISHLNNLVVIDSTSSSAAESFLALLRKTLRSLPVTRLISNSDVSDMLTKWVTEEPAEKFTLADCALLERFGDEVGKIKVDKEDLKNTTIQAHILDDNYYVSTLALNYDDAASFDLNHNLNIKKIKFFDVVKEQNDNIDSDDVIARLDADFCLMAGEIDLLILDLMGAFDVPDFEG
jgi:recombination associated protein RdgC